MGRKRKQKVVIGVDVGTTNIKCFAYDSNASVLGSTCERIPVLNLEDNKQEIEPSSLWNAFKNVVKTCLDSAQLSAGDVLCMGISSLRGTFVTWNKETGDTYHNFITWKDKRAIKSCDMWNSSMSMKFFRLGAQLLYLITRKQLFQVASVLKFTSEMVLMRLAWILEHYPQIPEDSSQNKVLFGTIDTWLVWKLTGGEIHATDGSNACVTGFFDPFKMQWAEWMLNFFQIPVNILPDIKNTSDAYGETLASIFGESIPIHAVVGDQQASMFGACCFNKYDISCTMGTGTFLNLNTGNSPPTVHHDIYPLVGWTIKSKTTYVAECSVHDTGTIINWAQNIGLFSEPCESSQIALSVSDNGVFFLPAQNLVSKNEALDTSSFIGLKTHTSKAHLVRAILESVTFQVSILYKIITREIALQKSNVLRICGGVSKNDFIVQLISDLTCRPISRLSHTETSSLGAAFLAGLYNGVWCSEEEIRALNLESKIFSQSSVSSRQKQKFLNWKKIASQSTVFKKL